MMLKPTLRAVLAAACLAGAPAGGEEALEFYLGPKKMARLTAAQLQAEVPAKARTFFDPRYGKEKTYRCLPMREVMRLAYGPDWKESPYTEASFVALDGYSALAGAAKLDEEGGCLAVADADFPGWEPVGRKRANPGPFYLAWSGEGQSTEKEYPWPYQLASIHLVRFEERFPEVVPKGAPEGSPAWRGYLRFRGLCLRCHSINRQGGKIGPDLNAPQSIVAYRSKEMIQAFIRAPSKFRYTEMPDHPQLSQRDLDDLYEYLLLKARQPEKAW